MFEETGIESTGIGKIQQATIQADSKGKFKVQEEECRTEGSERLKGSTEGSAEAETAGQDPFF